MSEQQERPVGHEEANLRAMADAMGPELANLAFRTASGESFYEQYGNKTHLPENLTQNTQQQGGQTTMGQGGQFSGYGDSNPQYGQGQASNFENQSQAREQYYSGQTQLPQNLTQGQQGGQMQQGQQFQQNFQGQIGGGMQGGGYQEWRVSAGGQATSDYYSRLPKVFNKAIVAVRKDGRGDILAFKLEDGTVLDYAQMLQANGQGGFQGLRVQGNREGELIIRSVPDGFTDNNLDNLPQF